MPTCGAIQGRPRNTYRFKMRDMFAREDDYPTAVASYDDDGVAAAIDWCLRHMEPDDTMSVWTSLKSNLQNCSALDALVQRYSDVEHITGRGWGGHSGPGPVLMAWPDMDGISELIRSSHAITALCVITWYADGIRPWVTAMRPEILGDGSEWDRLSPDLDPIVVRAMESLTLTINHNNTIAAGYEKDDVVSTLLALRDARIPMDAEAMQGWALAHGWSGKNPEHLAKYVRDINAGKRPRSRRILGADYINYLREQTEPQGDEFGDL